MTTPTKNKPALTLRDGALKATIWANPSEGGTRYSVEFSRSYTDQSGEWRDTSYFSGRETLRVARLAGQAYDAIAELRAGDKPEAQR